jgi:hypothetical protein
MGFFLLFLLHGPYLGFLGCFPPLLLIEFHFLWVVLVMSFHSLVLLFLLQSSLSLVVANLLHFPSPCLGSWGISVESGHIRGSLYI